MYTGRHCRLLLSVAITELIRSLQRPFLFETWWWSSVNLHAPLHFDGRLSLDHNLARCTILRPTCRLELAATANLCLCLLVRFYETFVYCSCTNLHGSNYKPACLVHHTVTRPAEDIWSSLILKWAAAKITPRRIRKCYRSRVWTSLSGTLLQTLPDLVTPLKEHSLSSRSCPATRLAPSERFGYWYDCTEKQHSAKARTSTLWDASTPKKSSISIQTIVVLFALV